MKTTFPQQPVPQCLGEEKEVVIPPKPIVSREHWHETTDRLNMIIGIIDQFLEQHPAVQSSTDVRRRVQKASELLAEAYQIAGLNMFACDDLEIK